MIAKSVSGIALVCLLAVPTWVQAATVCLDRDEFASLIQRMERTQQELQNLSAQVSLHRKADAERKEVIRISDDYIAALEQRVERADELVERQERAVLDLEQARGELKNVRWWRNAGWGTAAAMAILAVVVGMVK